MFSENLDNPLCIFCLFSGTGGSMLIIGSAAGVVAMGMKLISLVFQKNILVSFNRFYSWGFIIYFIRYYI